MIFHMLMRKQMILAILIIPLTLWTDPELQIVPVQFRPSADCALMLCNPCISAHFPLKLLPSLHLPGRHMNMVLAPYPEYKEIEQRGRHGKTAVYIPKEKFHQKNYPVYNAQYLHFNRYNKHQQHFHLRKRSRKGKENRHIDIIGREIFRPYYTDRLHCHPREQMSEYHKKKASQHSKQHARKQVYVITVCSPSSFQRCAKRIIPLKHNQHKKNIRRRRRHHHPRHQSPNLPMQYGIRVQPQISEKQGINKCNQISHCITHNQHQRQILNCIFPKFSFKVTHPC